MKTIGIKTKSGFEMISFSEHEYKQYLSERIDKAGDVKEEVVLFKEFELKVKEDTVEFQMSDMGLDRDNERIDPNGWDLKNFLDNPIILWGHDQWSPAIGRMENVRIEKNALVGDAVFISKDIDPFGWSIGERVRQGFLKKGSVGFIPKRMEISDDKEDEDYGVLIHKQQELLEYSIVNVPSLPSSGTKTNPIQQELEVSAIENDVATEQMAIEALSGEKKIPPLDGLFPEAVESEYLDALFEEPRKTSGDENFNRLFLNK